MKIYDGFIFSAELDLLELRLEFLYNTVDYFVLVESRQAISGIEKPLHYKNNESRYAKYRDKIIYVEAPERPGYDHWEYEYFQRNYIKEGLKDCSDEDIVLISDVDEIVNLPEILKDYDYKTPILIDLPIYYYFFNLRMNYSMAQNLLSPYKFMKDVDIGCRNPIDEKYGLPGYRYHFKNILSGSEVNTGWHLSNLFGLNIDKYVEKLKTFSHQEYNKPYYLDEKRIEACVRLGIDLVERGFVVLTFKDEKRELQGILDCIYKLGLQKFIVSKEERANRSMADYLFLVRKKYLPFIGSQLFNMTKAIFYKPAYKVWSFYKKKIAKA